MKYSEIKAAQVGAYFIFREGGQIKLLKLVKLMYLAERESLKKYGEPITGDRLVSMEHGPVLSVTLDHMNYFIESLPGGWESWISDRENHCLKLKYDGDPTDKLTQLCDADLEIVNNVYDEYGNMTAFELRDYTHEHCAEWEDPSFSSSPIPYSRVLKSVGFESDIAIELAQRIEEQSRLDYLLN